MFRSFIYLDEEKLYTYKRQIEGKNLPQPKTISKKKSATISAAINNLGVSGAAETSINGEFEKDISFDYDQFELKLNDYESEDYFDFVLNDYDLTTLPAMKLLRICSNFEIPEAFDAVNLIDRFMPMLLGQVETKTENEHEALESFFGNAAADIPFYIECDDITIAGKLSSNCLCEEYSNLEDYAEQDVYLLCKVVGVISKETVEIFDPLKDFIKLPRAMRRQMSSGDTSLGLDKITVEGPVLKVEVIAIYK